MVHLIPVLDLGGVAGQNPSFVDEADDALGDLELHLCRRPVLDVWVELIWLVPAILVVGIAL